MNITLSGPFTVVISGLAVEGLTRTRWTAALVKAGETLQDKIADAFAAQRTAAGQLVRNSPEYTAAKARQGYDTRRGHRTNTLQSLLRSSASTLFTVTGPFKNGTARITFRESALHAIVPYAEYYEEAKVRGAGILQIARAWLKFIEPMIAAVQAAALKALADAKAKQAAAAIARQRAAVFGGRPATIRPALGLTQGLATGIGRQVLQGASPAQRAKLQAALKVALRR